MGEEKDKRSYIVDVETIQRKHVELGTCATTTGVEESDKFRMV